MCAILSCCTNCWLFSIKFVGNLLLLYRNLFTIALLVILWLIFHSVAIGLASPAIAIDCFCPHGCYRGEAGRLFCCDVICKRGNDMMDTTEMCAQKCPEFKRIDDLIKKVILVPLSNLLLGPPQLYVIDFSPRISLVSPLIRLQWPPICLPGPRLGQNTRFQRVLS